MGIDAQRSLSCASQYGRLEIVKLFLKEGFHRWPIGPMHTGIRRAMDVAAENGHEEVVKVLLDHDAVGSDSIGCAARNGHSAIVRMLLDHRKKVPFCYRWSSAG